jgi:hypothetical protein
MIGLPPNSAEWMDDPTLSVDDLRATMADQSMLHRWLGGHGAALGKLRHFRSEYPGPVRILEMVCGASTWKPTPSGGSYSSEIDTRFVCCRRGPPPPAATAPPSPGAPSGARPYRRPRRAGSRG